MTDTKRLTLRQTQALFGVSSMCLFLWRTKPAAGRTPIPQAKPKKEDAPRSVYIDATKILAWAKKSGVTPVTTIEAVMATVASSEPRGPKPKQIAKAPPAAKKVVEKTTVERNDLRSTPVNRQAAAVSA